MALTDTVAPLVIKTTKPGSGACETPKRLVRVTEDAQLSSCTPHKLMGKKKVVLVSSNTTNPNHVTRLRKSNLPHRERLYSPTGQPIPFPVTDPWDSEAEPDDTTNTLIPVTPLLDAARQFRIERHGSEEEYTKLVASWEEQLHQLMDSRLLDAAIGLEKTHRQLDRDARLLLALGLAKYRKIFRGPGASGSSDSKAHKDRIITEAFDLLPDLAPDNRVFKTQEAEVVYVSQYDTYFRGRLAVCDKKEKELNGIGVVSKRVTKLEEILLAATKRRKTALDAWLKSLDPEGDEWRDIVEQEAELIEQWTAASPDGDLDDNRLQLDRAAKRKVFEAECRRNPKLYDEAKDAAKQMKEKAGSFSASSRGENTLDAVATLEYLTSRITDLADISVSLIVIGDFGEGKANAYVTQYGFPRGQALVDKSDNSSWSKAMTPLISDFVSRISPDGSADVRFGEVLPKIEASSLDKPAAKETLPQQQDIKLVKYNWDAERTNERAKAYFDANIRSARGLSAVMWKIITNKPDQYLRGLPDVLFYETKKHETDPKTGEIIPHPYAFTNPSTWSDGQLFIWEDHISKSERGMLPASQTLAFVDRTGQVHYACSALGNSPNDDGTPTEDVVQGEEGAPDEPEDFTGAMARVQSLGQDDGTDGSLGDPEEARNSVMKIKKERMASAMANTSNLSAPAGSLEAAVASATSANCAASFPRPTPGPMPVEQLQADLRIRRMLEVIPWKGLPPPITRGPQLSAAIEAICLDELLCFNHILSEGDDFAEPIRRMTESIPNEGQLAQLLFSEQRDRLCNLEQAPPQIHSSEDVYGGAFEAVVQAILAAVEEAIHRLFSPDAFLQWRLGGHNGLLLIFRTLSSIAPLQSRSSTKRRFGWAAIRLHYFTIILLSVRRSFLAAKSFHQQPLSYSAPPQLDPLALFLSAWEAGLSVRLRTWSNLVVMDDLRPLTEVANPIAVPSDQPGSELYIKSMELRWYDVPNRGTVWHINLPVLPTPCTETVEWLQTLPTKDLPITSLCHFGTCGFSLMVAASGTSNWQLNSAWSALIAAIQQSELWHFDLPIPSSSSDTPDETSVHHGPPSPSNTTPSLDSHPPLPEITTAHQPRFGTPVSPFPSPKALDIFDAQPAPMRSRVKPNVQSLDGQLMDQDPDILGPHSDLALAGENPKDDTGNNAPQSARSVEESHLGHADQEMEIGEDVGAVAMDPEADSVALPKKTRAKKPPLNQSNRKLRARKPQTPAQPQGQKRKSEAVDAENAEEAEPGPSKRKRPQRGAGGQSTNSEDPPVAPAPRPRRAAAQPSTSKPSTRAKSGRP